MGSGKIRKNPVSSNVSNDAADVPLSDPQLSDAQLAATALLATGKSYQRVADELNIDPRTLFTWRQLPAFRRALRARRDEIWCEVSDRFRTSLTRSMDVFDEFLNSHFDMNRFRAASTMLRHSGLRAAVDPRPNRTKKGTAKRK